MSKFGIFFLGLIFSFAAAFSWAADDGFGSANRIESEHFTIEYKEGVDINALLDRLKVSAVDQKLTEVRIDRSSTERALASTVEVLFNRASDVLDMHVYSYKGSIKVFADHQQLEDFFHHLFKGDLPCTGLSFYSLDHNTIYVAADNFRREILGHEIGHAIISRYFVVQPSVKVQEVLAGYVEYQLRKSKE